MLKWIFKGFEELAPKELYDALALRQSVFGMEQNCLFMDEDGMDPKAYHILGYDGERLVAYGRITFPGVMFEEVSIGRIVSDTKERKKGYGKQVTAMALEKVKEIYGDVPVKIAAQSYLARFYESFGFECVGEEYLWDGIKHWDMIKRV
jgi:ElaA protein